MVLNSVPLAVGLVWVKLLGAVSNYSVNADPASRNRSSNKSFGFFNDYAGLKFSLVNIRCQRRALLFRQQFTLQSDNPQQRITRGPLLMYLVNLIFMLILALGMVY